MACQTTGRRATVAAGDGPALTPIGMNAVALAARDFRVVVSGLALGGGGPVGAAWYAGLAEGFADLGVPLGHADIVIGTSAGAIAGACLTSDAADSSLSAAMLRIAHNHEPANSAAGVDLDLIGRVYTLLGHADTPLDPPLAREVGSLAMLVTASGDDPDASVHRWAQYLPGESWPPRFHAAVVNALTGELVLVGRESQVPLPRGVAASCAAPGLVAPVSLLGAPHIDGGARSATNADALFQFGVDRALIVSPVPGDAPMVGPAIERVLEEECRRLRAASVEVQVILPTGLERKAFGFDLLNLSLIARAIEAGRERGRIEARRLGHGWMTGDSS
jgi:NTE family protein